MRHSKFIANKFLKMAASYGESLGVLQLIKLVYIAHGWALGNYGKPLFYDRIEAWKYGPVMPELYHAIRQYRNSPIDALILVGDNEEELSSGEEEVIKMVYEIYRNYSPLELSDLTHQDGTPWDIVYNEQGENAAIPMDKIEKHYKDRIADSQAKEARS